MRLARLAELAVLNPGLDSIIPPDMLVTFVPMAGLDAERGTTSSGELRPHREVAKGYTPFRDRDLLVAKITPCFQNGKIGQAHLETSQGFGSTEFHVIRPNADKVDARYLLHFLRQDSVRVAGERRMTGSAGQRRVPEAYLADLVIPVPPMVEQRRIADILDRADALRAKRGKSVAHLSHLPISAFLRMFSSGDGMPIVTVGDVVDRASGGIRTGPFGSQLLHSEFVDRGVAVLGIDNAVTNNFQWGKPRFITPEKYSKLSRYTVQPGDVLITIMGTCGRCAVVPDNIPKAINTKHLCCISLDRERCLPEYLRAYFLYHPRARAYLSATAKGAVMDGLNMGLIRALPLVLPTLDMQTEFVQVSNAIASYSHVQQESERLLDALFSSLQHRAFQGEL